MGLPLLEEDHEHGVHEDLRIEQLLEPMQSLVSSGMFVEAFHDSLLRSRLADSPPPRERPCPFVPQICLERLDDTGEEEHRDAPCPETSARGRPIRCRTS